MVMLERLRDDKNLISLKRRVFSAQLRHRILEITRVWPVFTILIVSKRTTTNDRGQTPAEERMMAEHATDLYEPISSAVYTAPKENPPLRSSAMRVCANETRSTFERTASLRPNAERRASAAGVSGKIGHWASEAANATAAGDCWLTCECVSAPFSEPSMPVIALSAGAVTSSRPRRALRRDSSS